MNSPVRAARTGALWVIAVLIGLSAVTSFAESYRGLFDWSRGHGLPLGWAAIAPLMVDVFVAVGELTLFVLVVDGQGWKSRVPAWGITVAGLGLSVAGNAGHVWGAVWATRVTASLPPLAAAAALAVGLGVLKRTTGRVAGRAPVAVASVATPDTLPVTAVTADMPAVTADTAPDTGPVMARLSAAEEAALAGVSVRTVRRWREKERTAVAALNGHADTGRTS